MTATSEIPAHLVDAVRRYNQHARLKPVDHVRRMYGVSPHERQEQITEALMDPEVRQISWRSANGVGKTFWTAVLTALYLDANCPSYVVLSGASWTGVLKTIMPSLRRLIRRAPVALGGDPMATEWRRGDLWGAFCVSPDVPEAFGGFRTERGAMVIVDEASKLSYEAMEAIQGVCSAEGSKIVLLGNPLRPEGPFYDTFNSSEWLNFHSSAFDVCDLGIAGLATREWIEGMKAEYGENSGVYKARVKGDFPEGGDDVLVPLNWLKNLLVPKVARPKGKRIMGVDVARFGDDRTVVVVRDDRCVRGMWAYDKKSTMETVGLIQHHASNEGVEAESIYIDDTGLGGGVTDRLHELEIDVTPVNFGETALDRERFFNCRTEMYWAIRNAMRPDAKEKLLIPKQYAALGKECTWPRYTIQSDRKIRLEPKDKIKKRRGRSPDLADALALTYYHQVNQFGMEMA